MPTRGVSLLARCRAVVFLLGSTLLIGCDSDGDSVGGGGVGAGSPTAPGITTSNIRGIYSSPNFWTFEALNLASGSRTTWTCAGSVTIVRQTLTDFLGSFASMPPDANRCIDTTGPLTGGVIRGDSLISFATNADGLGPDRFFALPECTVVTIDSLWAGAIAGDRLVASRNAIVDCPGEGRVQVTGRADGPRTSVFG